MQGFGTKSFGEIFGPTKEEESIVGYNGENTHLYWPPDVVRVAKHETMIGWIRCNHDRGDNRRTQYKYILNLGGEGAYQVNAWKTGLEIM